MSAPAVSVLIVAYKSGPTLARCLEALRAQAFTDFEIVLVDNGGDEAACQVRVPLASRRAVQAARVAPWWSIAAAMTWNPADLLGRRAVLKTLKAARRDAA